jgi:hypothetical protein
VHIELYFINSVTLFSSKLAELSEQLTTAIQTGNIAGASALASELTASFICLHSEKSAASSKNTMAGIDLAPLVALVPSKPSSNLGTVSTEVQSSVIH